MNDERVTTHADRVIEAWNTQDVESVVACYAPDAVYRDPNTRGSVKGADALRRYLTKLFDAWQMHWSVREAYPLEDGKGAAVLWHATFQPKGSEQRVEADGMDLVRMRGELIERNDVYFDRAVFAPLMGGMKRS